MQWHAMFVCDACYFIDGLHCAHFVISKHRRYQQRAVTRFSGRPGNAVGAAVKIALSQFGPQRVQIDMRLMVDGNLHHFATEPAFHPTGRFQHRRMFDRRHNDTRTHLLAIRFAQQTYAGHRNTFNRKIIRFGAA